MRNEDCQNKRKLGEVKPSHKIEVSEKIFSMHLGVLLPKDFGARGGAGARFWFWSNTRPLRMENMKIKRSY